MISVGIASTNPAYETWFKHILNDSNDFFLSFFTNPFDKIFYEKCFEHHDVLIFHSSLTDNTLNPISFALKKYFISSQKPIIVILDPSNPIDLSDLSREIPIIEILKPIEFDAIEFKDQLKETLKIAGYISAETLQTFQPALETELIDRDNNILQTYSIFKVLLIGASTGGPKVIIEILKNLGNSLDHYAVVIAQHISHVFLDQFKSELEKVTKNEVVIIKENVLFQKGKIYVSPVQRQYIFGSEMKFIPDPIKHLYPFMPNIDAIFVSISSYFKNDVVYLILTGLGKDGSIAASNIMKNKGIVIAQNLLTAEVRSMPETVINNGDYHLILNPKEMVQYLINQVIEKTV